MELLAAYRQGIDALDQQLVHILGKRFERTRLIGQLKADHDLPAVDPQREAEQNTRLRAEAQAAGVDPDLIDTLMTTIRSQVVTEHRETAARR